VIQLPRKSFVSAPLLSPGAFIRFTTAALLGAALCTGCLPTINLATPQPVKVDVAVRLDIYQKTPIKTKGETSSLEIAKDRRLRSGEIQQLKNDRVIGETRDGYLDLLHPPKDPKYLAYAKSVVDAENTDRTVLYLASAQSESKPLELIEEQYAKLWHDRAYPGEWVQKENGTWTQK
jgi:uncharacterized protein YdbL (DUF1318 family)